MCSSLRVWSAMKRLNNQINCTEMKFWGKIFGLHCDYYIVQVRLILIGNIKFSLLEKIQHEKEISFDEIDIINRITHQVETKTNQQQVKRCCSLDK